MDSSDNWLLCLRLRRMLDEIATSDHPDVVWQQMERALEAAGEEENADLALPILERDPDLVRAVFVGWDDGSVGLPAWDKAVLKRALKAYRKRLKLMRLDDESSDARNPLSKGAASSILGIRPPEQYPQEIWDFLVAQGRLRDAGGGLLELTTI